MPIFSRLIFTVVRWSARRGLRDCAELAPQRQNQEVQRDEKFEPKEKARRRGLLGETYGYWYLRRQGYVFIGKNYMPQGAKGELDLVGYDGETIAFVEIRTRTVREDYLRAARAERQVCKTKRAGAYRAAFLNGPPSTRLPDVL